jgi:hypothetical protein
VVAFPNLPKEYYVALRNDHVISYGRKGDFGSARNTASDVEVHQSVDITRHSPSETAKPQMMADELGKLFELKKSGAITDQEYEIQKEKLLAAQ